ncbi:MAG: cation-translocating P-type ATPase [Oscillospiraceae bacterium]|nr:cation-translocating P-type ATPase [Oscillospiraceae bacterium]
MQHQGLTQKEAEKLLLEIGENKIASAGRASAAKIFSGQFRDAMILILLAATVLSALMGEILEAATIIAIVFLNAVLGFFQEYRTEKTLEKLAEMSAPTALVLRDGVTSSIPSAQIVPGDIIFIKSGDKVPADAIILECTNLTADESMLSGESENVFKTAIQDKAAVNETQVFMGSLVTGGHAVCKVSATGSSTEIGKIAGMISQIEQNQTPLQRRLSQLSKYIGLGCIVICAFVTLAGILRGENILDMLLVGISLSVAAVPEGLPAIVTIALALSVNRMVKRNALVRKLHAVESLGCANVICSDKTGTLTENKMTAKTLFTLDHCVSITGNGFEKLGSFIENEKKIRILSDNALHTILDISVMCSTASLKDDDTSFSDKRTTKWQVTGEPTEAALLVMAAKSGIFKNNCGFTAVNEKPFDSKRKMMSVSVRNSSGNFCLMTKGAPDVVLPLCEYCLTNSGIRPLTPTMRKKITDAQLEMAASALRVLGFAFRNTSSPNDLNEKGMVFVGLVGLLDPPRREAFDAVKKCHQASIKTIMITGDHAATAKAIAKQLKIYTHGDEIVTGTELNTMSDEDLKHRIHNISVFARVTPEHKLRIVRTLKSSGNIVAMTGDGINDAPAIKEADIGVSMGCNGTDVAKEASDIILLDDNFATLVHAVEEGRIIYQNIRKFIRYLLSCNIGEVITMFLAMLMGMPVPLLPIQILLVNLATDGLPAIALGLEPGESHIMKRRPRRCDDSVFSGGLAFIIIFRGILIGLTTLSVFVRLLSEYNNLTAARTGALTTLVAAQLIHVFECKSEEKSIFSINLFNNPKLVAAVVFSAFAIYAAVFLPTANQIFNTCALTLPQLAICLGYSAVIPFVSGIFLYLKKLNLGKKTAYQQ